MDRTVLNKVDPIVDKTAIAAAESEMEQRKAAIQREEAARAMRDEAVVAGYRRAPDRPMPESMTTVLDPNAPQVTPDVSATPFETAGLDETALRTYKEAGVKLSPSTEGALGKLDEEDKLVAKAEKAAERAAAKATGGGPSTRADEANREPDDIQTPQTSSEGSAEPNQPNKPDQPSHPNEVNKPEGITTGSKAAADKAKETGPAARTRKS